MESKSHHLLKTDATRPQTPENRVANDQLDQVTTPVGRTVPSHSDSPDTAAALLEGEMIWRTPDGPSFSRNYPTSTDVIMRLPRYQPLMPPVVMSPTQDGRLLMAHSQDRLQSEIEDLKAQYQSGDQRVSQRQSKSFWGFLFLRKLILVVTFAFIMFVAFAAITIAFASYIAPSLLELNDMMGVQTSEVKIHDVAVRGPNSVWGPHGGPASPLASASRATLSSVLKVVRLRAGGVRLKHCVDFLVQPPPVLNSTD